MFEFDLNLIAFSSFILSFLIAFDSCLPCKNFVLNTNGCRANVVFNHSPTQILMPTSRGHGEANLSFPDLSSIFLPSYLMTALAVARNGAPRIIGMHPSPLSSMIIKSTGYRALRH